MDPQAAPGDWNWVATAIIAGNNGCATTDVALTREMSKMQHRGGKGKWRNGWERDGSTGTGMACRR